MAANNQNQRLLAYLQANQTIQPLEAWLNLGLYRLGARIFDLRKAGYGITKTMVKVENRFQESCRVAEYRLGGV